MIWAFSYSLLEYLQPGSFSIVREAAVGGIPGLVGSSGFRGVIYFSFTTLTTLGYGDITPLTGIAQNLSVLEAVVGQIYLVVLVARLVGLHIASSSQK
jgi:hypothetical protein